MFFSSILISYDRPEMSIFPFSYKHTEVYEYTPTSTTWINMDYCEHLNFLVQKNMDYTLKLIGGDISTIPGLYDAIEV